MCWLLRVLCSVLFVSCCLLLKKRKNRDIREGGDGGGGGEGGETGDEGGEENGESKLAYIGRVKVS